MNLDEKAFSRNRAVSPWKFLAVFFCTLPVALGSASASESLQVLTGGYPHAFFFRTSEMMAASPGLSYEDWEKNFDRLMGIVGKALDAQPGVLHSLQAKPSAAVGAAALQRQCAQPAGSYGEVLHWPLALFHRGAHPRGRPRHRR